MKQNKENNMNKKTVRTTLKMIRKNPYHNIYNNNGTYWIHYTVRKGNKAKRLRKALKTSDINQAVKRRDEFFKKLECQIYGEKTSDIGKIIEQIIESDLETRIKVLLTKKIVRVR
jgi:hypothetical protein